MFFSKSIGKEATKRCVCIHLRLPDSDGSFLYCPINDRKKQGTKYIRPKRLCLFKTQIADTVVQWIAEPQFVGETLRCLSVTSCAQANGSCWTIKNGKFCDLPIRAHATQSIVFGVQIFRSGPLQY